MQRTQTYRSWRCDPNTGQTRWTGPGPSPADRREVRQGCASKGPGYPSQATRAGGQAGYPCWVNLRWTDPIRCEQIQAQMGARAQRARRAAHSSAEGRPPAQHSAPPRPCHTRTFWVRGLGTQPSWTSKDSHPTTPYLHEFPHGDGSVTWAEGRPGHVPTARSALTPPPTAPTGEPAPAELQDGAGRGPRLKPWYSVSWERRVHTRVCAVVHLL